MQFNALPIPEHPVIGLRPLKEEDLDPWFEYLNLPEVYQHMSWNGLTPEDLRSYLGNELDPDPSTRFRLAIALKHDNTLVGTIGYHSVSPSNRSAELAYDLHPSAWGKGFASAMGAALLRWGHSEAALVRVQATVLKSNTRSLRVLERLGFVREGLLRSYRQVRGRPGDFYMYAHVVGDASDV